MTESCILFYQHKNNWQHETWHYIKQNHQLYFGEYLCEKCIAILLAISIASILVISFKKLIVNFKFLQPLFKFLCNSIWWQLPLATVFRRLTNHVNRCWLWFKLLESALDNASPPLERMCVCSKSDSCCGRPCVKCNGWMLTKCFTSSNNLLTLSTFLWITLLIQLQYTTKTK